jgi:hypothetical protein
MVVVTVVMVLAAMVVDVATVHVDGVTPVVPAPG